MNRLPFQSKSRDPANGLWTLARSILLTLFAFGWTQTAQAQSPTPDPFNPGANGVISSIAAQADGRILVGGTFTRIGGQPRNRIASLNEDGSLNNSFNLGANDSIYALALQPDNKVLIGGYFTTIAGGTQNRIARLNTDGAPDSNFDPGANNWVYSISLQADGRVVVGGSFTTLGGQSRNRIARLNEDGSADSSFNPDANDSVYALAHQTDGKILVGGLFTTLGGQNRKHIARLNSDGTLDASFNPNPGASFGVYSLAVQPDGKILVGGWFAALGGQSHTNIARLNGDGTIDSAFIPSASSYVLSLAAQADGKVLVGGLFTSLNGQSRNRIARLRADGTLDATFNPGADGDVYSLVLQSDGKILVGGWFSLLGGQSRTNIARLDNTEPAFETLSYDGATINWFRGGTAPEVWRTTFEHTINGNAWTMLGAGSRIPNGWRLGGVPLALGTIRARGYDANGIVETGIGSPFIAVQPKSRTNNAGASATFGVRVIGSAPFTYQWRKDGVSLADGSNISGATTATLTVGAVLGRDARGYDLIVSNAYGSVTSAVASLSVNCLLNALSAGGGSVTRVPDLPAYPADSLVTLTATPEDGFAFVHWFGDVSGNANPLAVSMDTNRNLTAVFAALTVAVASSGIGTVARSPDKAIYSVGEQVTLHANAGRWHQFSGWTDGNTNNPRIITIDESNSGSYTAGFAPALPLETVTIGDVDRLAPIGMPAVLVDGVFVLAESATTRGFAWLMVTSTFPNSTLLYTVDGSDPALAGTLYTGPFSVGKSCLLRTIAYNTDFSQFVAGDPLSVVILPTLAGLTDGGGSVAIEPPAGAYFSNSLASATATAAPGWSFLHWLGDATGTNSVLNLSMTRDKSVRAVFGTWLSTAIVGGGSIVIDPTASAYPFGSRVRLTAVPANGNYLAFWANAASGMTNNPLTFTVTNTNPTVTAVFTSLGGGQTNSLTVIPNGPGQVAFTPPGQRFPRNTNVVLHAVAEAGQDFLGWSGATSGSQNPLVVTMTSNTVLTANFTQRPQLQGEGQPELLSEEGFRLTLAGDWGVAYRIDHSTNLTEWTPLTTLTNTFGTVQFTDGAATNLPLRFYRAVTPP